METGGGGAAGPVSKVTRVCLCLWANETDRSRGTSPLELLCRESDVGLGSLAEYSGSAHEHFCPEPKEGVQQKAAPPLSGLEARKGARLGEWGIGEDN